MQEIDLDVLSPEEATKCRERFTIQHKYLLDIYNVFETSGKELNAKIENIGDFNPDERVLCMVFEYFATDLSKQIQQMNSAGKRFSEEQLWTISRNLTSALAEMQEHGIPHGGLKTSMILIDLNKDY